MLAKKPRLSDTDDEQSAVTQYAPKLGIEGFLKEYPYEPILKMCAELQKTGTNKASSGEKSSRLTRKTLHVPPTGIPSSDPNMTALVKKAINDLKQMSSGKSSRKSNAGAPAKTFSAARKELFKVPSKPKQNVRRSIVRRSSIGKIPVPNGKVKPKKTVDSSPLVNLTQAEHLIIKNKAYPFNSPRTPTLRFNLTSIEESETTKTPESNDLTSSQEFMEMEKLCNVTPPTSKDSPISSVCSLLEKNMHLNSLKKTKINNSETDLTACIETFKEILECQRIENNSFKKFEEEVREKISKHKLIQEENMTKMTELITKLELLNNSEKNSDTEKENCSGSIKRRSLRLLSKSPLKASKSGNISPLILKSGDLRKSTLTKSLVSKCEKFQIDSPRIKKAVNMYNSFRQTCSGLNTPKIDRNNSDNSWRNTLSQKVQDQCLLLQDTPKHH